MGTLLFEVLDGRNVADGETSEKCGLCPTRCWLRNWTGENESDSVVEIGPSAS